MSDATLDRRTLLKNAALLSGALGALQVLPASLARALAIDPEPGSSWKDAEHIVILMQENRSFDHAFGALRGVRGFNDPRAITLPSGLPVWCQTGADGQTHAPFWLDIHHTRATWNGYLDHSRGTQVAAFNEGRHDRWVTSKSVMTLGHYDRRDIPFYYAFADAFTICDQHFCSAMTCTTPNRCYLWSGTAQGASDAAPRLDNHQLDHQHHPRWTTFPERLEEHGIAWKVYQNEVDIVAAKFAPENDEWLGNYGDNPLEYFPQYHAELAGNPALVAQLAPHEKALHEKAFVTNAADPDQHNLETLAYDDGAQKRQMSVPKGDLFHQFRVDVKDGKLPTVSWLVAPQKCCDHPESAWYGAWYVSEALDILTKNPEVWKKTVFILTYDENDGYFDHIPPFVPPRAGAPETGAVSAGLDTDREFDAHQHPIGLGFRVPMVVASPWSRGGRVNSQVFDHTSVLQFLEIFLSQKTGKAVKETNITPWRRAVCGDLTSVFAAPEAELAPLPEPVVRAPFVAGIHQAQFRGNPEPGRALTPEETGNLRLNPRDCALLAKQEPGTRPSCALPYELRADGALDAKRDAVTLSFAAGNQLFGARSAGAPFQVYALGKVAAAQKGPAGETRWEALRCWNYTVAAGHRLAADFPLADFADGAYHLRIHGPNGFYRELKGSAADAGLVALCKAQVSGGAATGNLRLSLRNAGAAQTCAFALKANAYGHAAVSKTLAPGMATEVILPLAESFGWYDFTLSVDGDAGFARRYAGRIETGKMSRSDPVMGG